MNLVKTDGPSLTLTSQYRKMIESAIPAVVAIITGGGFLFNRLHHRISDLDKRIDSVELRVVESYVSKQDFNLMISKMEAHLIRIEEKMDQLVNKSIEKY